ncbi:MAG TPA: TetR/AcrR family transcriptional regulator [candidate division Zixibacteria bacterium]|nr:TetR/AcrR family transcriptional regulator [candidate division Zixibacteria bacterium]
MSAGRAVKRDKQATRARILAAVGTILSRHGFAKLGINSIASEAGVDKVLIYRYFGNLDGLLEAYVEDSEAAVSLPPLCWPSKERVSGPAAVTSALLCDQLDELRRRPIAQATLRCETESTNVVTERLASAREKMAKEYLSKLPFDLERHPYADPGAVFALLHAGISYLVMNAARLDFYQGIDLKSARGWKRIEQAIEALVATYFKRQSESAE